VLAATVDGVRVIDLYVPNGQAVGSDKYKYKLEWLAALHAWLTEELARHKELVVLGDFNIAPRTRTCTTRRGGRTSAVLGSERAAFHGLIGLGFVDVPQVRPAAAHVQLVDYRTNAFPRKSRAAHRSHPRIPGVRRAPRGRDDRRRAPPRGAPLGSRPGARHVFLTIDVS
jgi:exonuclease III